LWYLTTSVCVCVCKRIYSGEDGAIQYTSLINLKRDNLLILARREF
jgi:hypothetical protein